MEKQIQELLDKLNMDLEGETDGKYYVISLDSYDEFVKLYNKLEKSLIVFKNSLASFFTENESHVQYETDDGFILELVGIMDEDDYSLNISNEEED